MNRKLNENQASKHATKYIFLNIYVINIYKFIFARCMFHQMFIFMDAHSLNNHVPLKNDAGLSIVPKSC